MRHLAVCDTTLTGARWVRIYAIHSGMSVDLYIPQLQLATM
jgi:hypothetical protein